MRLQNHEGADEVFMNFAPGGQESNNNVHDAPREGGSTYEDPLDDVFGSAPASPLHPAGEHELTTRRDAQDLSDIPRLRSVHVTNGYREGLAVSKEQHVQAGFDEGYSLGAELGMKVGWILGLLEGVVRAGGSGREELVRAEEELGMRRLFADEFFGGDGVWSYPVPGMEGEEGDVTFAVIASAHPLVRTWEARVKSIAREAGLEIAGA